MKFALTFWLVVSQNVSANGSVVYSAMLMYRGCFLVCSKYATRYGVVLQAVLHLGYKVAGQSKAMPLAFIIVSFRSR